MPLLSSPPDPIQLPEPILLIIDIRHTLLGIVKKVWVYAMEKRNIKR